MYYKSKVTNKIIASNFAKCLNYVYGDGTIEELVENDILEEIEDPSIEDCIRYGSGSVAVVRYRELNPDISWADASTAIRKMSKEMRDHQQKKKEQNKD